MMFLMITNTILKRKNNSLELSDILTLNWVGTKQILRGRKNWEMDLNYLRILTKRKKQNITKILSYYLMMKIIKKMKISKHTEINCCQTYKEIKKHFFKKMMILIGTRLIQMRLIQISYLIWKRTKIRKKSLRWILRQVFKKI